MEESLAGSLVEPVLACLAPLGILPMARWMDQHGWTSFSTKGGGGVVLANTRRSHIDEARHDEDAEQAQ